MRKNKILIGGLIWGTFSSSVNWGYEGNFKFICFLQKTFKHTTHSQSKTKKANKKTPKAAFFCVHKNFWGGWKSLICVLCFFVHVEVFFLNKHEIILIPSIHTTTKVLSVNQIFNQILTKYHLIWVTLTLYVILKLIYG